MHKQQGLVLVVAVIFLVVVTLIAVSGANIVLKNNKVYENFQYKDQVRMIARLAITEAIGTPGFLQGEYAFTVSCREDKFTKCYDMDGDGASDNAYVTLSKPECISVQPILNSQLNVWEDPVDASCYRGCNENTSSGRCPAVSLCADVIWNVDSVAYDPVTNAKVYNRYGLGTRSPLNQVYMACYEDFNTIQ